MFFFFLHTIGCGSPWLKWNEIGLQIFIWPWSIVVWFCELLWTVLLWQHHSKHRQGCSVLWGELKGNTGIVLPFSLSCLPPKKIKKEKAVSIGVFLKCSVVPHGFMLYNLHLRGVFSIVLLSHLAVCALHVEAWQQSNLLDFDFFITLYGVLLAIGCSVVISKLALITCGNKWLA